MLLQERWKQFLLDANHDHGMDSQKKRGHRNCRWKFKQILKPGNFLVFYGDSNVRNIKESESHSTHVSGIIAADRKNKKGKYAKREVFFKKSLMITSLLHLTADIDQIIWI